MKLSRRETVMAVVAVLAVALLVADRYVVTPLMEGSAALADKRDQLVQRLENNRRLFERQQLMAGKWREMTAGGLTSDPADAEGRVLHALRDWADEAGFALASIKPERNEREGQVGEITVLAAGTGPMRSVARFLWQVETCALPLRIHELQLGSRTEGADDLSLQLKLSTLYRETKAPASGGTP
jgi:hypothetical protein